MTPRQTIVGHVGPSSDGARVLEAVRVAVTIFHQRVHAVLVAPERSAR